MRDEAVDAATVEAARERAWIAVTTAVRAGCAEFRPDLRDYLDGAIGGSRRLLIDDHLGRCAACRAALAELKGERRLTAMPQRSVPRWRRWAPLAAAATLVLAVAYGSLGFIDRMLAPDGPRATVVSADGGLYRLAGQALAPGTTIEDGEVIRTGAGARAVLRLADGSLVDVNERTELYATAAWSGMTLHLAHGDVIVRAAEQRRGQLRVRTRDSVASVKGTVFAVSAGLGGSVVSVVEGSVAVRQPGRDVLLGPGEQAASSPALAGSIVEAVAWSPEAEHYLELLGSLATIERQLAENLPTEQRTTSALLPYLPAGAFAYGAIPNPGGRIHEALVLAEQQSFQNAAFAAWWNSETGLLLRQMVDRIKSVSSLLGEEIVFCAASAGPDQEIPVVIANVQPGSRAALAQALDGLFAETGEPALPYSLSDDLMVVSNEPENLTWALGHLGQGAASPFAAALEERYRRGAGWLMGVDAPAVIAMAVGDDAPPIDLAAMIGMKYLFFEQRAPAGAEENEVTMVFEGERTGMGSWLADAGTGGAAEYLPADALFASYVSMREPWQLFQEFTALMSQHDDSFVDSLAGVEATLGPGFISNLTTAMGSEAAFAFTGFSLSGPRWAASVLAYNPAAIDSSFARFIEAINAEHVANGQNEPLVLTQESAGGRVWNTVNAGGLPFGITWTYDRGYMVAASDRATAERAIATRSGGSPLVWSPEFLGRLPASAGLHPSAFVWLNTRGLFEVLSSVSPNQSLSGLLATREPVLAVFDVTRDRIHAASRTRLSGVILDAMLLDSLARTRDLQSAIMPTAP